MILLAGIPTERPLARVAEELSLLGADCVWFNQRQVAASALRLCLAPAGLTGQFTLPCGQYALERIQSAYARLMDDQSLPELTAEPAASPVRLRSRRLNALLVEWLNSVEPDATRVVNRPLAMGSNSSKPYQALRITRVGFRTPATLVTNDPDLVREFVAEHTRVIYKSVSGVRSIVREFTTADECRLERIRWCPTQFQAFVPGMNVRVHVVGKRVFATSLDTSATDYRYAHRDGDELTIREYGLADETQERCVRLAAELGLPFAGIDLKLTPDGEVFCFEVNPSPGFTYYEDATGQEIAGAVARYLAGLAP